MYLGFVLVLLGWAAFLSNLAALALLTAFVLYINRFQSCRKNMCLLVYSYMAIRHTGPGCGDGSNA